MDTSLSISTIYRQRKSTVNKNAQKMRKKIKSHIASKIEHFIVLHWDGKIIQYLSGATEDRLAIAISAPNSIPGQFLASPVIEKGTGLAMSNCVYDVATEYGLLPQVQAMVFDTTASNTGQFKGSVTLFEKRVGRALLWLACRHHVPELFIKHASIAVRGPTDAPEDPLFKDFKRAFKSLNLNERTPWTWPVNPNDWRFIRASEVLQWATIHMEVATWPREDYLELIELVTVFLGGNVKRVHKGVAVAIEPSIRKPGAVHRARFMASCLYLLKIYLYQEQYPTAAENLAHVRVLAEYVALLHAPYFLKSPLAISAPRQDRDFWVDVQCYQNCFRPGDVEHEMLSAVRKSIMNHLWYLTEELVILALFDENVDDDERKNIAESLLAVPRPATFSAGKPAFPSPELMTANPSLHTFVGERSWLVFHKLGAVGQWLHGGVTGWSDTDEYKMMHNVFKDLKVVNDLAERCIKDIQEYANIAKDSDRREDILLVVSDHRGVFQDLRKQALR